MLKRFICLIMCAATLPWASAMAEEPAQENPSFDARVEKLTYLGVTFDEGITHTETVTRAKFVRTILDFVDVDPYSGDCGFYDVDMDHPYSEEINTGAKLGYMIGYPNGYYYPDNVITVNDAIKVLVNTLGYEVLAKQNGGYPTGYIATADSIELLKGIKTGTEPLTYDVFSKLLENALECSVYKMTFENGNPSFGEEKDVDALWEFHRTVKVKAVVTANSVTGMEFESGKTAGVEYAELNGETVLVGLSNVGEYLGYSVEAYVYYEEDGEMGEVKYAEPSKKNVSTTVKAENVLSDTNEFSAYNFVYETETGKIKNVEIGEETYVIYNGIAKPDYRKEDLIPGNGNVLLIDNDSDGDVECIKIFKAEIVMIVDYVSVDDEGIKLVDKKDSNVTYFYDNEYEFYSVFLNGTENNPSSIGKDMVVLIGANGEHSITYAFSNLIEGKITSLGKADDGIRTAVRINDKEYILAKGAENYPFKLGVIGKFWVDDEGFVYGFEKTNLKAKNYAYFVKGYFDENESPVYASLRVLTVDNEFVKLELNEELKINGVKKEAKEVLDTLRYNDNPSEDWEDQLIMYEQDENGKIKALHTVTETGELRWEGRCYAMRTEELPEEYRAKATKNGMFLDDEKKIYFGYNHGYNFYADTWQNLWYQDAETIYFNINKTDLESSYISAPLTNTALTGYTHDFYNVDEELNTVDVVIWERGGTSTLPEINTSLNPAIVKSVTTVLDPDDIPVNALVLEQNGKTIELAWNEKAHPDVRATFMALNPGDIIYYSLDGSGKLDNMYRAFDVKKVGQYGMSMTSGEVHNKGETAVHLIKRSVYVRIKRKLQNNFFSYEGYDESSGNLQKMNPSANIYRMTVKNGKVTVETITYDDVQNGDEVFYRAGTNNISTMIVLDIK